MIPNVREGLLSFDLKSVYSESAIKFEKNKTVGDFFGTLRKP